MISENTKPLDRANELASRGLSDKKIINDIIKNEKPIPKKLPAELYDKVNYMCRRWMDRIARFEIEYDFNSDKTDKYNRHLVWVFVDGDLLQEKIIQKGYAEVAYLYGDYKYTNKLEEALEVAKKNKVGMWSEYTEDDINYIYIVVIVGVILIICIFSNKFRKKLFSKIKKEIKKKYKSL